jgi:hypothetical protein
MTAPTFPKVSGLAGNLASSLNGLYYETVTTLGRFNTTTATVQGWYLSMVRCRNGTSCADGVST